MVPVGPSIHTVIPFIHTGFPHGMRAQSEDSILNFPDLYDAIPGILFTVPSNVPPPEHHNRPQQPQDRPPVLFTPFYSHQNKINKCEDNHPTLYMYGPGVCRKVHHGQTCGQRRSSLTICGAGACQLALPRPSHRAYAVSLLPRCSRWVRPAPWQRWQW